MAIWDLIGPDLNGTIIDALKGPLKNKLYSNVNDKMIESLKEAGIDDKEKLQKASEELKDKLKDFLEYVESNFEDILKDLNLPQKAWSYYSKREQEKIIAKIAEYGKIQLNVLRQDSSLLAGKLVLTGFSNHLVLPMKSRPGIRISIKNSSSIRMPSNLPGRFL